MDVLSNYTADPEAEEIQLLRQAANHSPLRALHRATKAIAWRLNDKGDVLCYADFTLPATMNFTIEITARGRRRLGIPLGA